MYNKVFCFTNMLSQPENPKKGAYKIHLKLFFHLTYNVYPWEDYLKMSLVLLIRTRLRDCYRQNFQHGRCIPDSCTLKVVKTLVRFILTHFFQVQTIFTLHSRYATTEESNSQCIYHNFQNKSMYAREFSRSDERTA